jgi:hypothetical protein
MQMGTSASAGGTTAGEDELKDVQMESVTVVHVRSGIVIVKNMVSGGPTIAVVMCNVPESPTFTRLNYRLYSEGESLKTRLRSGLIAHAVSQQDWEILTTQNDNYLGDAPQLDRNTSFDAPALRHRNLYLDLVARQRSGDYSYLPDANPGADMSEVFAGSAPS